jgi:hypothetical protein
MENFEKDLMQSIQNNMLNQVRKAEFIQTGYGAPKVTIPQSVLNDCFNAIDIEKVKQLITARIEEEVAGKIVNSLLTECANDVKQIMSNKELREDLRGILRAKIKEAKDALQ